MLSRPLHFDFQRLGHGRTKPFDTHNFWRKRFRFPMKKTLWGCSKGADQATAWCKRIESQPSCGCIPLFCFSLIAFLIFELYDQQVLCRMFKIAESLCELIFPFDA